MGQLDADVKVTQWSCWRIATCLAVQKYEQVCTCFHGKRFPATDHSPHQIQRFFLCCCAVHRHVLEVDVLLLILLNVHLNSTVRQPSTRILSRVQLSAASAVIPGQRTPPASIYDCMHLLQPARTCYQQCLCHCCRHAAPPEPECCYLSPAWLQSSSMLLSTALPPRPTWGKSSMACTCRVGSSKS
jgi:hypothetical protein